MLDNQFHYSWRRPEKWKEQTMCGKLAGSAPSPSTDVEEISALCLLVCNLRVQPRPSLVCLSFELRVEGVMKALTLWPAPSHFRSKNIGHSRTKVFLLLVCC